LYLSVFDVVHDHAEELLMNKPESRDLFAIPLPGNRVAHVPLSVLEQYAVDGAQLGHGVDNLADDVTAHNMTVDATTGVSVWHIEWELGPCDYLDDSGPRHAFVYHRHPLGTEYTEIWEKK
jgi:hypothetical protein